MASAITKTQLADRIVAAKKALDALVAKNSSLKLKTGSTAMKIPLIETFQKLEGTLKVDGLYGVNTRTALMWYLQTYPKPQTFPAVNSSWAKQALTWKAPQLEPATVPATSAPASAPVVVQQKTGSTTIVPGLTPLEKAKLAIDEANAKAKALIETNKLNEKQKTVLLKKEADKKKIAEAAKKAEEEKKKKADAKKKKDAAAAESKARQEAEKLAKQKLADAAKNDKTSSSEGAAQDTKAAVKESTTTKKEKKKPVKSSSESSVSTSFFATTPGKVTAAVGALAFVGGLSYYSKDLFK